MATRSSDRTGILIVHLWVEEGTSEGFRARITQTLDSRDREQTGSAAANPEDVYTTVRTWVEGFVDAGEAPGPLHPSRDASVTPRSDGVTDISDFRRT
jgi:hypothetical protein